ncbi:MAG: hypothetical protein IKO27_07550 [Ruminococcus sp.]|nr:hypothetical protein [Ruminococcus sp.]
MNGWKSTLLVTVVVGAGGAVMLSTQDVPPYWAILIAAAVALIMFLMDWWERRDDKKSFEEARKFEAGYAFKDQREEQKYYAWAESHPPRQPSKNMLSDLIARYRTPGCAAEFLGVVALGLIEIILFKEKAEGKGEPAVIYIVMGGMIILLYLGLSNLFGFKARRLYGKLEELPNFEHIRRSYADGLMVGRPMNRIGYISIGSEYITLIASKGIAPIDRSLITRVCRANMLTAYYTNDVYTGRKESYFIKVYAASGQYRVQLTKFQMVQAYELLKRAGLPCDDTIEMR